MRAFSMDEAKCGGGAGRQGAEGEEAAEKAARGELALTETALRKNPKSYSTWHYRRWVVSKQLTPLEHELELIGKCVTLIADCYPLLLLFLRARLPLGFHATLWHLNVSLGRFAQPLRPPNLNMSPPVRFHSTCNSSAKVH